MLKVLIFGFWRDDTCVLDPPRGAWLAGPQCTWHAWTAMAFTARERKNPLPFPGLLSECVWDRT